MKRFTIIAFIALPVGAAALFGLDALIEVLRERAMRFADYGLMFWLSSVVNVIYALLMAGLAVVVFKAENLWVKFLYILVGGALVLYAVLRMTLLRELLGLRLNTVGVYLFPFRGWSLIGAFFMAVGAWGLLGGRGKVSEAEGD